MPEEDKTQERPSLPKPLKDLVDEAERLDGKREAAKKLGMGDAALAQLDNAIKTLKEAVALAVVEDAKREIEKAQGQAGDVAAGVQKPAVVKPGPDQQRLAALDDEIKRINDKLKKAREHGARDSHTDPITDELEELDDAIRDAALGAAKRELEALKQEIEDIEKGKGPQPTPNGQGPGPHQPDKKDKDDKDKDVGKGGSGGGGGSGGSGRVIGEVKANDELPAPNRTYVRSQRSVWAWSRRDQEWIRIDFDTDIIQAELISGGIMVVAESGAALFDATFGRWLARLNAQPDTLIEGASD